MKRTPPFFLLAFALAFSFTLGSFVSVEKFLQLGKLPKVVTESSGLAKADQVGTYWTHNDAGNEPIIYKVSENGKLLHQVTIPGASNTDWEDLARDNKGHLYIADTGNNSNKRQELNIYKVATKNNFKTQTIQFTYEDQPRGKLARKDHNFDCEAVFWHSGKLYLISKDRGESKTAKLYELPDAPGTHVARLVDKELIPGMVTSADLSPDGRRLAVLSFGKIYLFPVKKNSTKFFGSQPEVLELVKSGQVEAVTFKDNQTLIISNEGGSLFKYSL